MRVAMSLDGQIAGPHGEYDWIGADTEVDFAAFWMQFDMLLSWNQLRSKSP
jgi:hypothetical protein